MQAEIVGERVKEIPKQNVWYLLLYAWDLGRWKDRWSAATESAPNLLGLLARILVDSVATLLRRQLGREFKVQTAEISGLRGKILITPTVRRLSLESGRAVCAFPTLGVDTMRNRVLKSTLQRLLHDSRLESGASPEQVQRLRREIWWALQAMKGVSVSRVQTSDFSRLRLGRNDRAYQLPLAICGLIHRLELPTESQGDTLIQALLRDEKSFWRVFETFVRNFYRTHLYDCVVKKEMLRWPDEERGALVPTMDTDVSIEEKRPGGERLVIDTKYYWSHLTAGPHGDPKLLSANLYQLYAYLRTQEERGPLYRHARGILLYPCVRTACDEKLMVQGHAMWVCTLDLMKPWADIEKTLLFLASRALSEAA